MSGILLKGGRVIDPASKLDKVQDVLLKDGKVAEIGVGITPNGATVVECKGLVVSPGFVDIHVHLREPGQEGKETVASGTRAAALGGVTSVACMPNTLPALDSASIIRYVLDKAADEGVVHVYPVGCISKDRKGEVMADLAGLKEAGCVAFSDDGNAVMNALLARRAMINCRNLGVPYIEHAEDEHLIDGGVMHEGEVSLRLGLAGRSAMAEDIIVGRDIQIAAETGAHFHVAHISSGRSVEMVRKARAAGVHVTAEVTPHHLVLTDEAVGEFDTQAKVNPPIRDDVHRQALLAGLKDGTISVIATDHAPHGPLDKEVEFSGAASGMIGLQTLLPLVLEHVVKPGVLSLPDALRTITSAPAELLGLPGGRLSVGGPGDVTVFDPAASWVVESAGLASKSKNTPFLGWKMTGKVIHTIVNGAFVVVEGKLA